MGEPERRFLLRVVSSLFLILFACALQPVTLAAEATPRGGGPMPMAFEPNQGQADAAVKFLARGRGYGLFLTPTEAVLVLAPAGPGRVRGPQIVAPAAEPVVVRMRLVGADPEATIAGVDPLPGRSHYLTRRTFTVLVFPDIAAEGNETVLLSLSNLTGGATLGPRSTATLTIVDND